jgi:hypothetical protein
MVASVPVIGFLAEGVATVAQWIFKRTKDE